MPESMRQYGYPFEPGKRGILLEGLEPTERFRPLATAHPGRTVRYIFTDERLTIDKDYYPEYSCGYIMDGMVQDQALTFCMYTRSQVLPFIGWKRHHPDFFATKFALAFYQHLTSNGVEITAIKDFWPLASDNYQQFYRALTKLKDPTQAAYQTWEGRLALSLGFTRLLPENIRENGEYGRDNYTSELRVEFQRP